MGVKEIILFIVTAINVIWGVFIFFKNKRSAINISYAIFSFGAAGWAFTNAMFFDAIFLENAIFWARLSDVSAIILASSIFYFSLVFPKEHRNKGIFVYYFLYASTFALLLLLALFPDFAREKVVIEEGQKQIIVNNGFYFFALYIFYFLVGTLINFLKKYKIAKGNTMIQLKYVLIGFFIVITLGSIFNLVLPLMGNYELTWLGPYTAFILSYFMGYTIVRHRLMDIKFVLRQYSVNLASLISIILPSILIKYIVNNYFSFTDIWIDFGVLIMAISFFPTLKSCYYRIANKYFFTSLYDPQQVIAELSDRLSNTLRLNNIFRYISGTMTKFFHCQKIIIFNFNKKRKKYIAQYEQGFNESREKGFLEEPGFYTNVIKPNRIIVINDLKEDNYLKYRKTIDFFRGYNIEILVPLKLKDEIIGLIALGHKESKDDYNDQDLGVLEIIGGQSAIAIDNALHYEEIKNFSKKLEKEVADATKELRIANKKLKQLDEAKSEFVSIASHQLRTPLTIVKGYISMMLDGSFGRIPKILKESLTKVYISNERLIQLVENLLNISRIESGRLSFRYEIMQLEKIVNSVVEELSNTAKQKGLKLKYSVSKKLLPQIRIDSEKIRQVILNLIDNAIKYTKSGHVYVRLKKENNNLLFCVSDSGMGINEKDLSGLFDKFTRGVDTSLIHTEGTGLGLYVAKQMIVAHKGKIWAESDGPGKGSKFCFILPLDLKIKNNLAK